MISTRLPEMRLHKAKPLELCIISDASIHCASCVQHFDCWLPFFSVMTVTYWLCHHGIRRTWIFSPSIHRMHRRVAATSAHSVRLNFIAASRYSRLFQLDGESLNFPPLDHHHDRGLSSGILPSTSVLRRSVVIAPRYSNFFFY